MGLGVRASGFLDQIKGAPDVDLGGVNVPNRDPKGITATDTSVGEIDLAGRVHLFQKPRVVLVQSTPGQPGRAMPEHHG